MLMIYPLSKYKFYTTPDNKTIAISTYAGKTVKGVAKTDPRDDFDPEFGKNLAAARCAAKVARKRKARASKQVEKAARELAKAQRYYDKMKQYEIDSVKNAEFALFRLTELEAQG